MNLQRKLSLMVATGAIALGAGHIVQKRAADRQMAAASADVVVTSVMPVAAGPDVITIPKADYSVPALVGADVPLQAAAATPVSQPEPEKAAQSAVQPVILATVAPQISIYPIPAPAPPVVPVDATPPPALVPAPEGSTTAASNAVPAAECARQLDLFSQPGAMIGLTLLAPCNPNERVVLLHAGLAVTAQTTPNGTLFANLPALTAVSEVEAVFASGDRAVASIDMPEAAKLRRFAVQWQDADAFQLHAFENGADYNQPGHISAAFTGIPGVGGFISILGDATTSLPLLAEVYTFGSDQNAEVVLEAAVTKQTCGREILGETLMSEEGSVEITDLNLAMPDCDGVGDILVLKNLMQNMKLAAAN